MGIPAAVVLTTTCNDSLEHFLQLGEHYVCMYYRLLEMGFKEEITEIVRLTPKKRQTMLFSATLSDQVHF